MEETDFFNTFGWTPAIPSYDQARQEIRRIELSELDKEVNALMEHYGIARDSQGMGGSTTLSEIGTVVERTRHRADAYSKVLNELYLRTGYRLVIANPRKTNKEENENERNEN